MVCHNGLWGHPKCLPKSARKSERVSAKCLEYARQMRENMTPGERCFFESLTKAIRKKPIAAYRRNLRVIAQYVIDTFIVDFYMPQVRLAIEIDGGYHATPEMVIKDNLRDTLLQRKGITVIRFPSTEDASQIERNVKTILDIVRKLRRVVRKRAYHKHKRHRKNKMIRPP